MEDDIDRCPFGYPFSTSTEFQSIDLLVHEAVRHVIDQDIFQAISDSPAVPALDGLGTLVVGGMAVGKSLAENLAEMISSDARLTLLVPHAYAIPDEVATLQDDFDDSVVAFSDKVYVIFKGLRANAEIIRRALASMIGGYSVAWLFDDEGALACPAAAIVSIFDGDGFAVVTWSRGDLTRQ